MISIYNVNGRPNQFAIEIDGKKIFQSYESLIAVLSFDIEDLEWKLILSDMYNYSATTTRHLYTWLRDNGTAKYCDLTKKELQKLIKNGEVKIITEAEMRGMA